MVKTLLLMAAVLLSTSAVAADIVPFSANSVSGAGCVITSGRDVLIAFNQMQVGGTLVDLKVAHADRRSIKWTGQGVEALFKIHSGKIFEDGAGGFREGKGPNGTLKVNVNGRQITASAREECYGD